jgi:hypothetical protein
MDFNTADLAHHATMRGVQLSTMILLLESITSAADASAR